MTTASPQAPATEARCLLPGCNLKLTDPKSVARGRSRRCWAKVQAAANTVDLSPWTPAQVEEARQAIEDGAVVPSNREGVFHIVSSDGSEVHRTHRDGCNCVNGLKTRPARPCYHRCAVAIVLATSAPVPRPALAAAPIAVPAPAAAPDDVWTALEAAGALDLVPAF
jgi:hypothetical protein